MKLGIFHMKSIFMKGFVLFHMDPSISLAPFSWEFSTKRYKQHGDGVSISFFFFVMYLCQVLIWNIFTNFLVVSICLFIWNVFLWLYLGNREAFCFTCEYMFIPNQRHGASVWGAFSSGWCYHAASIEVWLVHIVIFLCWFSYEILLIFSYEMWLIELLRVTTRSVFEDFESFTM